MDSRPEAEEKRRREQYHRRSAVLLGLFLFGIAALLVRLYVLQVVRGPAS
jgi:hypothetical protein